MTVLSGMNMNNCKIINDIFASVLTKKCFSQNAQVSYGESRDWDKEIPPTVEYQFQEKRRNLKVHKSKGPDETHVHFLRELMERVANLLPSYLRRHDDPVKFTLTGKGETKNSFLKEKKRRHGELEAG